MRSQLPFSRSGQLLPQCARTRRPDPARHRPNHPPGHLQTAVHLIEDTIHALGVKPAECALIMASANAIEAAHNAGTQSIGYAATPAESQHLTAARAGALVPSLADLTLRLRERPPPN